MTARSTIARNGWTPQHLALAMLLVAVGIGVTFDAWRDIFYIAAKNEENSYIFLVPIIAAWLVWVRRERFRYCYPTGTWIGPTLVAIGWSVSLLGYYNAIESFWHGGAVLVLIGCFVAVAGKDVLWRFLPAFVVLVFLVPVPGTIRLAVAVPLQSELAQITQGALDLVGVPVEVRGNVILVNGTQVEVAEPGNGMRMVFAMVLVSFAFAFGTPLRNGVRVLVIIASPFLALLCNVVRVIMTVWLYGYASAATADWFHDAAAYLMVVIAFGLLTGLLAVLRWAMVPVARYNLAYD